MSGDASELPQDVALAVDLWLDGGGDLALDGLGRAVSDASDLDGDLDARRAGLARGLGGEAPAPRTRSPWPAAFAAAALVAAIVTAVLWPSASRPLVTVGEAAAPMSSTVTRGEASGELAGPTLRLSAPPRPPGDGPFGLVLVARPNAAGVPLDRGSLTVTYRRGLGVDLTPRLRGRWEGDEYVADGLTLPRGEHPIEFAIADEDLEWATLRVVWTVD